MRMLRWIYRLIIISLMFSTQGYGGKIVKAKYAGEFMATGVGARALGMGGTFVAVAEDITAGYWNPAALTQLEYPQLAGMHAQQFASIVNYNYGAVAMPLAHSRTIALSLIRLGVDDIPNTTAALLDYGADGIPNTGDAGEGNGKIDENERLDPNKVFYFNSAEYAVYMSYATKGNDNFYYGGNLKLVHKGIGDNSAWGMGFDIACLWQPLERLSIGANLQDVTTTLLAWDTGRREAITPTLKTGLAYRWEFSNIASVIIPAFDMDIRFENRRYSAQYNLGWMSFDLHAGAEYRFKERLALRAGLDTGHFTAGFGVKLPKLNVDYAFLSHHDLGDTHRISLILTIEEEKFRRK
ncbi:MAG: PorV/PorQ family protein [candidate division KSB1 bacterium]|nr:PorV/PorQ family protein [candidate division KSB1 bacterium]